MCFSPIYTNLYQSHIDPGLQPQSLLAGGGRLTTHQLYPQKHRGQKYFLRVLELWLHVMYYIYYFTEIYVLNCTISVSQYLYPCSTNSFGTKYPLPTRPRRRLRILWPRAVQILIISKIFFYREELHDTKLTLATAYNEMKGFYKEVECKSETNCVVRIRIIKRIFL